VTEAQRTHEQFMRLALDEARKAGEGGDVPVGCVIVRRGDVIAVGSNHVERTGDPTQHAEMIAIRDACDALGSKFLDDCTLYVTLEPCAMCAGAIIHARIPTLVFGATEPKTGAVRSLYEIADDGKLNHRCLVRTGILESDCASLLKEFFEERRSEALHEGDETTERTDVGMLVLVPTPIGNLGDITMRALDELKSADVIMCEDTRMTGKLLKHYGIGPKPLSSNHDHNERQRAEEIVKRVVGGERVVLVSDAGMPGISDPGYRAVKACRENGLPVMALPGANAAITAVAASGLPTDAVTFLGFPPQKKGRSTFIDRLLAIETTIVLYESPYRLVSLLEDLAERSTNERRVVVAREISKKFEEYLSGTAREVLDVLKARTSIKGEIVVVIEGAR
jgi:16S rRNA (cytidine1402-2'-O)-methyltransferase